jgi:prepilin-type N-terminal cleavage/methylation domain-containing protein
MTVSKRRGDLESARARRQGGFTLIELGLVILILGVMIAIALPRFGNRDYAQLNSETRKLALAYRYLRHAAILNGRSYRLMYDLDNHAYWAEVSEVAAPEPIEETDEGLTDNFFPPAIEEQFTRDVDGPLGLRKLPEPIGFSDVELPTVWGKVFEGIAYTTFYPDGFVDISVIHLDNGQDVFTLYVPNGITGQVFVDPGYLSWNG